MSEPSNPPGEQPENDSALPERPLLPKKNTLLDQASSSWESPSPPARKQAAVERAKPASRNRWLPALGWVAAIAATGLAVSLWLARLAPAAPQHTASPPPTATPEPRSEPPPDVSLPPFAFQTTLTSIARRPDLRTIIPSRPRAETLVYEVDQGDAIFSIAAQFNIEPETVLWANYELLNDNPDFLEIGMQLNIPPVNGVYYQWQEGDTLGGIAETFEADVDAILEFSGNHLDLSDPEIEPGQWVMLPGGHREFRQWLIPTIARGNAGVNSAALGPGACSGSYTGAFGSGAFIWPSNNHTVSGNDYWSGHLAIDIGAVQGDSIFAADAGVVVFSGWANGGYGYTVVVDHGNGYQTLYAHLSSTTRPCGASVGAGTGIGLAGSTGNSTGAHLHFEVRLNGGFINPWYVLPPP